MSTPRITVVMPTYNKSVYLRRTLTAWLHQDFHDYEIILVDDGSTDATNEVLNELQASLPLRVVCSKHRGRGAARNLALESARGSTVVFTDDDRIVSPRFLSEHLAAGKQHDVVIGWQRAVTVELRPDVNLTLAQVLELSRLGRGLGQRGNATPAVEVLSAQDLRHDLSLVEALAFDDDWFCRFVQPTVDDYGSDLTACGLAWMFGTTGNMSAPMALLREAGGFDESLDGWGLEDTELHYRLTRKGASTYVCREAVNYHQNHPRNETELMHQWVQNALRMYKKHTTLEVALYLRMVLSKLSLREMDQILREARGLEGSALLANFEVLQRNHVLQLAEARRDTHAWASRS